MTRRKTVLITGCSQGSIGDALAQEFHARGLEVFATSRRAESTAHLRPLGIHTLELDVTDYAAVERCKSEVESLTGGTLDILMNNAGQSYVEAALDDTPAAIHAVFGANVFGPMAVARAFAPLLIAVQGVLVNTGSAAAVAPVPFGSGYNASKAALAAWSDTLRIELAPFSVQVVYLAAGGVQSNISKPHSLPPGSLYEPMSELFHATRIVSARKGRVTAQTFASRVVGQVLRPRLSAWIWEGTASWPVWFVNAFLPRWVWEWIMARRYGLDQFTRILRNSRKEQDRSR